MNENIFINSLNTCTACAFYMSLIDYNFEVGGNRKRRTCPKCGWIDEFIKGEWKHINGLK